MSTNITLSKESSEREIKAYFNEILKLSQSDNEFPVNFDDVWMLVYQDKHKAVNELKEKFIESVDYYNNEKYKPNRHICYCIHI